jgi:outer membrane protein TolC
VTTKVAKVVGKTLSKTNRLYNKWVEVEQMAVQLEQAQIDMEKAIDQITSEIE